MLQTGVWQPCIELCMLIKCIKDEKNYLEAKNAANEEQHNEDQAHITKSSNLFFVGEVIGLHGIWKNIRGGSAQY